LEPSGNERRCLVRQSENDDAGQLLAGGCRNFSKIKIEGQHNARLAPSQLPDFGIGQALQSAFAKMKSVVSVETENPDGCARDSHVAEESHCPLSSHKIEFFLRQRGSILKGLADVVLLEVRVFGQDFRR
jgi:hypothetical protein